MISGSRWAGSRGLSRYRSTFLPCLLPMTSDREEMISCRSKGRKAGLKMWGISSLYRCGSRFFFVNFYSSFIHVQTTFCFPSRGGGGGGVLICTTLSFWSHSEVSFVLRHTEHWYFFHVILLVWSLVINMRLTSHCFQSCNWSNWLTDMISCLTSLVSSMQSKAANSTRFAYSPWR